MMCQRMDALALNEWYNKIIPTVGIIPKVGI